MPGSTPENRRATYKAMIDTLAALHNTSMSRRRAWSDFGKPGNYFGRQVDRWTKAISPRRNRDDGRDGAVDRVAARDPLPEQTRTSVVHGDYRIDNMIYAKDRPEVLAVLDWELVDPGRSARRFHLCRDGVGHRKWRALGRHGSRPRGARHPRTRRDGRAVTARATGRDGVPDMNWYFAYNFFRLAGIIQGIKKRVIEGTASSQHAEGHVRTRPSTRRRGVGLCEESRRMSLVRHDRAGRADHRIVARHRQGHGRGDGRAGRESRDIEPQGRRLRGNRGRNQRALRRGHRDCGAPPTSLRRTSCRYLVAETRRAFGKITALVCNAASNPYYGPGLGISDDQFRKIMDNNILSNHWLISMVAPEMLERGEGSIIDHQFDRRAQGIADHRRLRHFEGSRHAGRAQFLGRVRAARRAGQLHRAGAGAHRHGARPVGKSRESETIDAAASTLKRIGEPHEIAGAAVFLASKAGHSPPARPSCAMAGPRFREAHDGRVGRQGCNHYGRG